MMSGGVLRPEYCLLGVGANNTEGMGPSARGYNKTFSHLDKREVLEQEYSQLQMLPSPHFRLVVTLREP